MKCCEFRIQTLLFTKLEKMKIMDTIKDKLLEIKMIFLTGLLFLVAWTAPVNALEPCPSDPAGYWTECTGVRIYQTDLLSGVANLMDSTLGSVVDFLGKGQNPNVKNIIDSAISGSKYEGDFLKNKRHGFGVLTLPNGTTQRGIWKNNTFVEEVLDANPVGKTLDAEKSQAIEPDYRTTLAYTNLKKAFNAMPRDQRMRVQSELSNLGYYKKKIDGSFGYNTYTSLMNYVENKTPAVNFDREVDARVVIIELTKAARKDTLCVTDPSMCEDAEICKLATILTPQGAEWSVDQKNRDFIVEAKMRNLQCVEVQKTENQDNCKKNATLCSNEVICLLATDTSSGEPKWSTGPILSEFTSEAHRRNLVCGVQELGAKTNSCEDDEKTCSDEEICLLATEDGDGNKKWVSSPLHRKYVSEAKYRLLTCGLTPTKRTKATAADPTLTLDNVSWSKICQADISKCTNNELCSVATLKRGGTYIWAPQSIWDPQSIFAVAVDEAKRRDVPCGVE